MRKGLGGWIDLFSFYYPNLHDIWLKDRRPKDIYISTDNRKLKLEQNILTDGIQPVMRNIAF